MPFLALVWLRDNDQTNEFLEEEIPGRVVGIYRFPKRDVKLCRGYGAGCRHNSWRRHDWGHMVHSCGLRNPRWWHHLSGVLLDMFGKNLLSREDSPALFHNPEGWDDPINAFTFGPSLPKKKTPQQSEDH